jgi:LmbE family N-acetylglucosaminyl deacetylase
MPLLRQVEELEALRDRPRRLLAVFPHPDDEAYGCAGALARHGADPDAATVLLCLTRGEASTMGRERGLGPDEVGALREGRLERVAAIVGLDALIVPGLPDGRLARIPLDASDAPIRAVLDAFRPQVVVGHDPRGVNGHPDHIAAHWAVRRALADAAPARFAMIAYAAEVCEAAKPRLLFPTTADEIDVTVDLTESETDAKEACLRVHEALVTLRPDGAAPLHLRPAVEHYDLLGEDHVPALADLFAHLA